MTTLRKIKSRAFRFGFVEGLGAPALTFAPRKNSRASKNTSTIASAWKDVEAAILESCRRELEIDKASCKKIGSFGEAAE